MYITIAPRNDLETSYHNMVDKDNYTLETFLEHVTGAYGVYIDGEFTGGFKIDRGYNLHYGNILDLEILSVTDKFPTRKLLKHLLSICAINECNGIMRSKHISANKMVLTFIPSREVLR